MLLGLKLEEGMPFVLDEKTKDWIPAPTSAIPEMDALLRRMEQFSYPSRTVRENIILEKEFDIGTGRVKSFQDEDGDLTVVFRHLPRHSEHIDEDAAFGLGVSSAILPSTNTASEGWPVQQGLGASPVQTPSMGSALEACESWFQEASTSAALEDLELIERAGMSPKKVRAGETENEPHPETRPPSADSSFLPPAPPKVRAAKKTHSLPSTERAVRLFKKRPASSIERLADAKKSGMRTLLLRAEPYSGSRDSGAREPGPRISFIAKNTQLAGSKEDSVLLTSMIRFNKMNNVRGVFEENFYLVPLDGEGVPPKESRPSALLRI